MKTLIVAAVLFIGCRSEEIRTETAATSAPAPTASGPAATASAPTPAAPAPAPAEPAPAPQTCSPAPDRLCPVDESGRDPSFVAFRDQLRDAVAQKNEAKLKELLDPNIRTSFGNGGGRDDFKPRWPELEKVLSLGGSFRGEADQQMFWAPYVYANWPESVDAFQHVAAIRPDVAIREEPNSNAPALTTVSWAILERLPDSNPDWFHVKTPDGREGWLHTSDAHSPVGYRAGFSKRSGRWLMEAFVAGD